MINKNLVVLSYGSAVEYNRAIFCILSFVSWCETKEKETRIIVYTDRPEFFQPYLAGLPIEYFLLSPELLEEMRGTVNFFHRIKVSVVGLTFERYPDHDLLFLDSDTFFIKDGTNLLNGFIPGQSFMHLREYTLEEGLQIFTSYNQPEQPAAFINYITDRDFFIDGQVENFTKNDYSWNSGVLGLTKDFAKYMPDVFQLTEAFYKNSKWFLCEQLAFSLVLQRKTVVRPSDEFVLHYWGKRQKVLMDRLLEELLHQLPAKDLTSRSLIRAITKKWKKRVKTDMIIDQAVTALDSRSWVFGLKKIFQLTLTNPSCLGSLVKELSAKKNS